MDDAGRRYRPTPDPAAVPFDVRLRPHESIHTTRVFEVPAGVRDPALVLSHGGGFPSILIIGDSDSLFHEPTVVRLGAPR
jgi:hypothetical protein